MSRFLPMGHYSLTLLAIGGQLPAGGLIELQFAQPFHAGFVVDAVRQGLVDLVPRQVEALPAKAWWVVDLAYRPGTVDCRRAVGQVRLARDLQAVEFEPELRALLPAMVASLAQRLVKTIGVEEPVAGPGDLRPSQFA